MKKDYKNILNYKAYSRLRLMSTSGVANNNGMMNEFVGEKEPINLNQGRRAHFDKIGGMDKAVKDFLSNHFDISDTDSQILRTSFPESIHQLPANRFNNLVNLKRLNDIKEINKFLNAVNHYLPSGGYYAGCVETKLLRRKRLFEKIPNPLRKPIYSIDFIWKRVLPKLVTTRKAHQLITGGKNKVLSKTESLGRIYAAGFEVVDTAFIKGQMYFIARKIKAPLFDYEPIYGPIFKMRRHGKDGKIIHVYKLRTMHAYSEFIQQYVYENNSLAEGGKLKDDFRVSTAGKIFRKYWLDELPMLLNLLKGDLKIVGVRPLSSHYLSLYSDELKQLRKKSKPGLIPPFYVDLPKTLDEIQASEMKYLKAHLKSPLLTDIKYFFMIFYTIIAKRATSK